ncbi:MAG: hypothetical protein RIC80_15865 [Cyclobacteriaceae bacterium]
MVVRSWREQKVMLKWRYPFLMEEDFQYKEGEKESMLTQLAAKIKKTRQELELIFAEIQLY